MHPPPGSLGSGTRIGVVIIESISDCTRTKERINVAESNRCLITSDTPFGVSKSIESLCAYNAVEANKTPSRINTFVLMINSKRFLKVEKVKK